MFSANTGFLWRYLPFVERITRARAAGFEAVEFHDEAQSADLSAVQDALSGLPVIGLNCRMGTTTGCAGLVGHETQALRDVDDAARVARALGAGAVHVLAGIGPLNRGQYVRVLRHALAVHNGTILIEPICQGAIPGYGLQKINIAADILREVDHPRLKILFDWFHIQTDTGDAEAAFRAHMSDIGHVQIASVPDRAEPFPGVLDYARLIPMMRAQGYAGAFGCEYRPQGAVEEGLGWRALL